MASTAKNLINSVPHTAATTFAFSSVFNLLLCYILSSTYQSWLWLPWPSLSSGESQEPVKPPRLKKLARQQSKQVNRIIIIIIILIIIIIIYLARQQSKQVNLHHQIFLFNFLTIYGNWKIILQNLEKYMLFVIYWQFRAAMYKLNVIMSSLLMKCVYLHAKRNSVVLFL